MSWQDNVLDAMAQRHQRRGSRGPQPHPEAFRLALMPLHFHADHAFVALIDSAAAQRDINRSSYVRRAIAAMVAHDLDLPIRDVLHHCPAPGPYRRMQYQRGQRDDGTGITLWCSHPHCDGSHL